jgi:flavodoxin
MKRKMVYLLLLPVLAIIGCFVWSAFGVSRQRSARVFPKAERIDLGRTLVVFYSLDGSTKEVAGRIGAMTGGTLIEIETEKSCPASPMVYITAWRGQKSGKLPALKTILPDYSSFDVIFAGSPVWFSTLPSPTLAFLSQTDFRGKTVVPFSTQGGRFGDFFDHFGREARNAKLAKGMAFSMVSRMDVSELDKKIAAWLKELRNALPC